MAWQTKDTKSPPFLVLSAFYKQRVLEVLQQAHAISILRHAILVGEGSNRSCICTWGPPLSLFDMLLGTSGVQGLMCPLWFALLSGSFLFLDVGPSILFVVLPRFWVLWFMFDWQGFITKSLCSINGSQGWKLHWLWIWLFFHPATSVIVLRKLFSTSQYCSSEILCTRNPKSGPVLNQQTQTHNAGCMYGDNITFIQSCPYTYITFIVILSHNKPWWAATYITYMYLCVYILIIIIHGWLWHKLNYFLFCEVLLKSLTLLSKIPKI